MLAKIIRGTQFAFFTSTESLLAIDFVCEYNFHPKFSRYMLDRPAATEAASAHPPQWRLLVEFSDETSEEIGLLYDCGKLSIAKKRAACQQVWGGLPEIAERFGLEAGIVEGYLEKAKLVDRYCHEPTSRAYALHYVIATPLKSGKDYILWNMDKVSELLLPHYRPLGRVAAWTWHVIQNHRRADEETKKPVLAQLIRDTAYDEVPAYVLDSVRTKVAEHYAAKKAVA